MVAQDITDGSGGRGNQLVGAVMFGDIGDSSHYLRLIEEGCSADSSPATLLAPSSRVAS